MLTVHERLNPFGVVIHFASCRARARKDRRAFWLGPCLSQPRLLSSLRTPLPPKPEFDPHDSSHLADLVRTKTI